MSDEVARHHLDLHNCPKVERPYAVGHYYCEHDGATARVIECAVCDAPLAVIVPVMCEHVPDLLADLNDRVNG